MAGRRAAPTLAQSWTPCRDALAAQAPSPQQQALWELFGTYADAQSQLAPRAFEALMREHAGVPVDRVPQMFYAMAVLGGPALSWDELRVGVAALHEAHTDAWGELRCQYIFRYYDANHDGLWHDREFAAAVRDIAVAQHAGAAGQAPAATIDNAVVFELAKAEAAKFSLHGPQRDIAFADLLYQVMLEPDVARRFRGTSLLWRLPARPPKSKPAAALPPAPQASSALPPLVPGAPQQRATMPDVTPDKIAVRPNLEATQAPKARLSRLGSVDVVYYERDQNNAPLKVEDPEVRANPNEAPRRCQHNALLTRRRGRFCIMQVTLATSIVNRLLISKDAIPPGPASVFPNAAFQREHRPDLTQELPPCPPRRRPCGAL